MTLSYLFRHLGGLRRNCFLYKSYLASVGIIPKSAPCQVFAGVSRRAMSFCSHLVYRDDSMTPRWMLCLERALPKAFYSIKAGAKDFNAVASATLRSRCIPNARTPIVREMLLYASAFYDSITVKAQLVNAGFLNHQQYVIVPWRGTCNTRNRMTTPPPQIGPLQSCQVY